MAILITSVVSAQTETPLPIPTTSYTATPDVAIWSTIPAPGGGDGQPVLYKYEMDSGQALTNALLFAIFIVNSVSVLFITRKGE